MGKPDPESGATLGAENYTLEAAYVLQGIWASSGEVEQARKVTEEWLVI